MYNNSQTQPPFYNDTLVVFLFGQSSTLQQKTCMYIQFIDLNNQDIV